MAPYEDFVSGLAVKRGKLVLIEPLFTSARRLFLMVLVLYGADLIYMTQILIIWSITFLSIIKSQIVQYYEKREDSRVQVLGDLSFLSISYFFLIFNVVDVEVNFVTGYYPIAVIGLYISVMLLSIFYSNLYVIKNRLAMYFTLRS